jgi:hypothetical protein
VAVAVTGRRRRGGGALCSDGEGTACRVRSLVTMAEAGRGLRVASGSEVGAVADGGSDVLFGGGGGGGCPCRCGGGGDLAGRARVAALLGGGRRFRVELCGFRDRIALAVLALEVSDPT